MHLYIKEQMQRLIEQSIGEKDHQIDNDLLSKLRLEYNEKTNIEKAYFYGLASEWEEQLKSEKIAKLHAKEIEFKKEPLTEEEIRLLNHPLVYYITAIRAIRRRTGLSLKASKRLADSYKNKTDFYAEKD